MNKGFPDRKTVERLRQQFPAGCRVVLHAMEDVQAPPIGTKGTVIGVDDAGHIMVSWDNGGSLNFSPEWTAFPNARRCAMTDKVRDQILAVRATGRTNMFDLNMVQNIANEMNFYELVIFIEEDKDAYVRFILAGEM